MNKKLVGLSMVRNESDIIETFIRHNLTLLDELHIIDHNSSDNTREILTHLKQEGLPIHIYHYNELEFAPERVLNHMMQHILNNLNVGSAIGKTILKKQVRLLMRTEHQKWCITGRLTVDFGFLIHTVQTLACLEMAVILLKAKM